MLTLNKPSTLASIKQNLSLERVSRTRTSTQHFIDQHFILIEKQVRTLLLQDDADFGVKYDDRIFEHSFIELQRLCHRQIVHKIFEKVNM